MPISRNGAVVGDGAKKLKKQALMRYHSCCQRVSPVRFLSPLIRRTDEQWDLRANQVCVGISQDDGQKVGLIILLFSGLWLTKGWREGFD
jgi:hypothetical protein